MAALDAKTVNAKRVETVKLNCIQKALCKTWVGNEGWL